MLACLVRRGVRDSKQEDTSNSIKIPQMAQLVSSSHSFTKHVHMRTSSSRPPHRQSPELIASLKSVGIKGSDPTTTKDWPAQFVSLQSISKDSARVCLYGINLRVESTTRVVGVDRTDCIVVLCWGIPWDENVRKVERRERSRKGGGYRILTALPTY
jgi:hypothetical protein